MKKTLVEFLSIFGLNSKWEVQTSLWHNRPTPYTRRRQKTNNNYFIENLLLVEQKEETGAKNGWVVCPHALTLMSENLVNLT